MNNITAVSQITNQDLVEYIGIPEPDDNDLNTVGTMLTAAKAFMKAYTGQSELDAHDDFVMCAFVLVQDMYDNRTLYVDTQNLNFVVKSILDLHSVNLL